GGNDLQCLPRRAVAGELGPAAQARGNRIELTDEVRRVGRVEGSTVLGAGHTAVTGRESLEKTTIGLTGCCSRRVGQRERDRARAVVAQALHGAAPRAECRDPLGGFGVLGRVPVLLVGL